jgi:hypothetical protein
MLGFEIDLCSSHRIYNICKDIWDNPEKYYEYEGDSYYDFLKYLWVKVSGHDIKLSDVLKDDGEIINRILDFEKSFL